MQLTYAIDWSFDLPLRDGFESPLRKREARKDLSTGYFVSYCQRV